MPNISTPLSYGEGLELNRFSWQAAGLVGWWPLGADNTGRDWSGYGNNGYKVGGQYQAVLTTAHGGGGMLNRSAGERTGMWFDPASHYFGLDIGVNQYTAPNGAVDFSITCWSRTENFSQATGGKSLVSRNIGDNSFEFGFGKQCCNSTHTALFKVATDASTASTAETSSFYLDPSDNALAGGWIFLAGTFCAGEGTLSVYVRGGATGNVSNTVTGMANTIWNHPEQSTINWHWNSCNIGTRGSSSANGFGGLIDDVRIYHRPLSEAQVDAIYENTRDGSYGDLASKPQQFYNIPFTTSTPPAEEDTIDKLLIENDDVLLLEDGTYVLLQSATVEGPLKPQSDIRVGPSLEFDVASEVIQENLRGGGRITVCNGGIVSSAWSSGPRLVPNTQVVVNKYDNRLVRGVNQGDRIAKRV